MNRVPGDAGRSSQGAPPFRFEQAPAERVAAGHSQVCKRGAPFRSIVAFTSRFVISDFPPLRTLCLARSLRDDREGTGPRTTRARSRARQARRLERRLREAENALAVAARFEEAEQLRATIETRNALAVKAAQWVEATMKLSLTLHGDQGDNTRTQLNDQARKLASEFAKIDLPEAIAARLPEEAVTISGEAVSTRDAVIIQARRLMGL
jgi:hypothetical protein